MPSATREPGGQALHRGERFLLAVAEAEQRVEDVARAGCAGLAGLASASLPFSSSSSRSAVFLPMPGTLVRRLRVLQRHRLREIGDRKPGEHGERGARADAGDADQLAERGALLERGEAVEDVRVLAHHEVGVAA